MNKKLIALAVAGAMAGPAIAAAADVEIYGKARVSIGMVGNGAGDVELNNTKTEVSDSEISITSHDSRFGIKGSEDLGNGLTAVYQIESKVDLDNGGGELAGRDSFVGLAGGFGTVLLGHHDTPYKLATKKSDIWGDTYADIDTTILSAHNNRIENVLAYVSPDMGGFTFIGAFSPDVGILGGDDDLGGDLTVNDNGTPAVATDDFYETDDPKDHQDAISLAVLGAIGPVDVSLAYQSISNAGGPFGLTGNAADESLDGVKLSGGYAFGDAGSVSLVYEMVELDDWEQDNIVLTGKFNISDSTAIKAIYGMSEDDDGTSGDQAEGSFVALGVTTKLSKTVEAYALYAATDNDNGGTVSLKGVDAVADASDADSDAEASAFAVGLNISFSSK